MKKIIFYSMPLHGHTNPTLTVARELAKRGNNVIYYSYPAFKEKIESAGLEYRSYDMKYYFDPILGKDLGAIAKKLMQITESMAEELLKVAEKDNPNCIAYDSLNFWGKLIGKSLHTPSVSLCTTFAINNAIGRRYPMLYIPVITKTLFNSRDYIYAYKLYLRICKKYDLPSEKSANFLLIKDNLNLVFTSSYLQPCSNSFGKTFKFTGPSIYQRQEKADFLDKLNKNKKTIYISMGTIYNDNASFYSDCINMFAKTNYQVIISLGHRLTDKDLKEIPSNIIVKNYVPQLDVLKKVDLFITHAGLNSISESLLYGVPMILIPQMYEQVLNAYRVQELGAGIYLKQKQVNPENILRTVDKVINTKSYYGNANKIKKTLVDAGGYQKAAEEILQFIGK